MVAAEPLPKNADQPKGEMVVTVYDRSGQIIDKLNVTLEFGRKGYGFQRRSEDANIAGFTIENSDPAGIAIDDIIFDETKVSS